MIEIISTVILLTCGQVIDHPLKIAPGGSIMGTPSCTHPATINILTSPSNCKPAYVSGAHEAREPDTGWLIWDGLTPFHNETIVGVNKPWRVTRWTPPQTPSHSPRVGQSYFLVGNQYNNRADEWSWNGTQVIAEPNIKWSCDKYAIQTWADDVEISNVNIIGGGINIGGKNALIEDVEVSQSLIGVQLARKDLRMDATLNRLYIHDTLEGGILSWAGYVTVTDSTINNIGDPSFLHTSYAAINIRDHGIIKNNIISNVGYDAISTRFGSKVKNNTISGFCTLLGDGAGIYMGNYVGSTDTATTFVANNTISNGNGNHSWLKGIYTHCAGLYADEHMFNILAENNTISDVDNGVHIHISHDNEFLDNKCTNCNQLITESNRSFNNTVSWK